MEAIWQQLQGLVQKGLGGISPGYLLLIAAPLPILYVLLRMWRRRRKKPAVLPVDLSVDVTSLPIQPPVPGQMPQLEFAGLPVRLGVVVLAPSGRANPLPPRDQFDALFEAVVPGLAEVVARDRPAVYTWPEQLSSEGFARSFFANVPLPGDRGRGTPWCSVAGMARWGDRPFLVGLVMMASRPNSFVPEIVEHEGDWYRLLRVRFDA
ncbi:hypothetical protein JCM19992_23820 [Thermostilla marina]